jgi:putative transposase
MSSPRGPRPAAIHLTAEERHALETLARRPSTPQQLALRARIVLAAADGLNNTEIARQFGTNAEMPRRWRTRWLASSPADTEAPLDVVARLADAERPGAPARFTAEQFCQLMALACEVPEGSDVPISHWSRREIADEAIRRGIFQTISPRHVGRFLKGGGAQAAPKPLLADASAHGGARGAPGEDGRDLRPLPRRAPTRRAGRTRDQHR